MDLKMYKPFRPPLLKSLAKNDSSDTIEPDYTLQVSPAKKRRLSSVQPDSQVFVKPLSTSTAVNAPRKPLLVLKSANEPIHSSPNPAECPEGYYMVLWRKFTMKKHKTWDGDGILSVYGGCARLQDISGRDMGRCVFKNPLLPGSTLSIGGKDVEIDSLISKADFLAGRPFLKNGVQRSASPASHTGSEKKSTPIKGKAINPAASKRRADDNTSVVEIPAKTFYATTATHKSTAIKAQFKNPLLSTTVMPQKPGGDPNARHDPRAPNALVMKRPKTCPKGKQIVDVVLDPLLDQHLRPHQREGVKFLYECVMGLRDCGQGALLADEMGLGKTLQTIALLWTLLKQNPIHGSDGGVIKKALIVCPVTLIQNWNREFNKWLGNSRIGVFIADGQKIRLTDFTHGRSYSVMIIGYEKLRSVQDELKKGPGIDIVVADEGHRLKTAQNKSAQAIRSLDTQMRIVLTGTPMQNDLSEFYIMADFVNPGILGNYNIFKKEFESPIVRSRQPGASEKDIEKGVARGEELGVLTKTFILRRTAGLLSEYLPPKTEYVLFCKPTQAQAQVYQHVLENPAFGRILGCGSTEASLQLITMLKKVCNAPNLLASRDEGAPSNASVASLLDNIPTELLRKAPIASSSKFRVLDRMLRHLSSNTSEKIVLVSNYTKTLDLLGNHLSALNLPFLRLDGSTPTVKRMGLVNMFNRTPASQNFAFLLSAKSGGTGINLIGASRLVLFDVDWNPATDLQAMARIHRDGQKHPVKIYRFLMAGGMDEKIYQRQVTKMGLADSVVDGRKNEQSFSADELRDLFRLDMKAGCQTHDLLNCACNGRGVDPLPRPSSPETLDAEGSDHDGSDSDIEKDFPANPALTFVPGTRARIDARDKEIADYEQNLAKDKGKMQALMQYKHIDTSVFMGETKDVFDFELEEVRDAKAALADDILVKVLEDERCKVCFVFAKGG